MANQVSWSNDNIDNLSLLGILDWQDDQNVLIGRFGIIFKNSYLEAEAPAGLWSEHSIQVWVVRFSNLGKVRI